MESLLPNRQRSFRIACRRAFLQVVVMCNSYRIVPKQGADKDIVGKIAVAAGKLASPLVRKSDQGLVVLENHRVEIMRWGFHRNFNPSINNARSDKLETGMWRDAIQSRRCVIPMSLFHDPGNDYLWIAGIWEESSECGRCYSMITTDASPWMARIHDRMPALLRPGEMGEFLGGTARWNFQPYAGSLVATPCASPLVKPRGPDAQQELF